MIAQRRFSLDDQVAFAALSGDWNPLHIDPVAARRTLFGEPIVHGIHLVLWALDRVVDRPCSLQRLSAKFRRPTSLDADVVLTREGSRVSATVGDRCVLELDVEWNDARPTTSVESRAWPDRQSPVVLSRDEIEGWTQTVTLELELERAARLFPALATRLPAIQLAELLATTRVVGMRCPGLHSIYSGLQVQAASGPAAPTYAVSKYTRRFSAMSLTITGPTLSGTIDTFYRPPPFAIDMATVAKRVTDGEFADRRALIVGGSRGLGEALAKAIVAGGGQVCVTYQTGRADAERVVRELGSGHSFRFDVTAPDLSAWPAQWTPTHLYYCATPPIKIDRSAEFSTADHERFLAYYVVGLEATIAACHALSNEALSAWAPSTVFLDTREPGAEAYCMAKAAMEALRDQLPAWVRLATPRLPRIATDQTAALIAGTMADPVDIAVEQLRAGA